MFVVSVWINNLDICTYKIAMIV